MIDYKWDEAKRRANLKKHKLDFRVAWCIYEHPNKVTVVDEYPHEERLWDLAEVGGMVLVYTLRSNDVRCISFRVATRKERESYYEEIANR
jgi:uncharacterized DUF497 family protein